MGWGSFVRDQWEKVHTHHASVHVSISRVKVVRHTLGCGYLRLEHVQALNTSGWKAGAYVRTHLPPRWGFSLSHFADSLLYGPQI